MQNNSLKSYNIHYQKVNKSVIIPDKLIKLYIKAYQLYEDRAMLKRIIEGNQRYVSKYAYKYSNDTHYIVDLINEANIGLIHSIKMFDTSVKTTFLTYATFYIRKSIIDYIYKYSNHSHIPFTVINKSYVIYKFIDRYYKEFGTDPSIEVIEKEFALDKKLNINKEKILSVLDYRNNLTQYSSSSSIEPDTLSKENENLINDIQYLLSKKEQEMLFDYYGINTVKLIEREMIEKYELKPKELEKEINHLISKLKTEFLN